MNYSDIEGFGLHPSSPSNTRKCSFTNAPKIFKILDGKVDLELL